MAIRVTPQALRERLRSAAELALLDIREPGEFKAGHLLLATNAPLSRLELIAARLLPRARVPIVVMGDDDDDPRPDRAVQVLAALGYREIQVLSGDLAEWARQGFVVFTGFNVPSKAFGEWLEIARHTPAVDAGELERLVKAGSVEVIDCRPADEHARGAVPGARNLAGVELVRHFAARGRPDERPVVVHCAGRTRGIVAAQSLIDFGWQGAVRVLENGLIGWQLAGFELAPPSGHSAADPPSTTTTTAALADHAAAVPTAATRQRALDHARQWASPCSTWPRSPAFRRKRMIARSSASTYAPRRNMQPPPPPGFRHVPGGQLVQQLDDEVGVRGARIVLLDPALVRAASAAAYLQEMGGHELYILDRVPEDSTGGELSNTAASAPSHSATGSVVRTVTSDAAMEMIQRGARVVDLGNSRRYRQAHLPGAEFAVRAVLHRYADRLAGSGTLLLSCDDGRLSHLAAPEFEARLGGTVAVLEGGVAAWRNAGMPLESDARLLTETVDVATTPYDYTDDIAARMQAYIDCELTLVQDVERDDVVRFGVGRATTASFNSAAR